MVRHGVAATVSSLAEKVELDQRLMIGDRGVISYLYSVALLIDCVEQAKGFPEDSRESKSARFRTLPRRSLSQHPIVVGNILRRFQV